MHASWKLCFPLPCQRINFKFEFKCFFFFRRAVWCAVVFLFRWSPTPVFTVVEHFETWVFLEENAVLFFVSLFTNPYFYRTWALWNVSIPRGIQRFWKKTQKIVMSPKYFEIVIFDFLTKFWKYQFDLVKHRMKCAPPPLWHLTSYFTSRNSSFWKSVFLTAVLKVRMNPAVGDVRRKSCLYIYIDI